MAELTSQEIREKNEQRTIGLTICGTHIARGEKKCVMIHLPHLYHNEPVLMPTYVIAGKKTGPTLLVTAAIHGDEINGTEICRRLIKARALSSLRGQLIVVPVVNVYGYLYQSRYLMDRRDLNRSFPGSASGSIAARLAKVLVSELLSNASHIIDLHTGSLHRSNLPQIRASLHNNETLRLARAFNAPVIIDSREHDGSLRQIASDLKKPFLLYEAGEALRFDEHGIRLGLHGIINTMRALKMINDDRDVKIATSPIISSTHWLRACISGNWQSKKKLGAIVDKDEIIGTIANPFDLTVKKIISPYKGIVIGQSRIPPVHEGQALAHIAILEKIHDPGIRAYHHQTETLDETQFFPEDL